MQATGAVETTDWWRRPSASATTRASESGETSEIRAALAAVTSILGAAGETRPGQAAMAEAVARAIHDDRHLIVQAGTGTGKSIAYLIPAVLSGSKVIVATATKALQDQLATKDLPLVSTALGDVDFAVLKGRANYICLQKAHETAGGDTLDLPDTGGGETARQLRRVLAWAATSTTGDRAELEFEPSPRVWAQVSTASTDCPGALRCPAGEACFAEEARRRAEQAAIVVVNTHLYGAHMASGGHVLPDHDVVIFDEAHELEDIAAASLGLEITAGRFPIPRLPHWPGRWSAGGPLSSTTSPRRGTFSMRPSGR